MNFKESIRKLIPEFILSWYHFCLSFLGALIYGFPSKKMFVVGVTGTKGKTTTCNIIAQVLNIALAKTGMATTVNFRIGDKEWINATKQTMLGRFKLQKLLAQMVKEGCKYAVVETSSEGIIQHRHTFIDYDVVVFTNLSPEHIERHKGFENYRAAKMKLFEKGSKKKNSIGIYNLDDENVDYFLKYPVAKKIGYTLKPSVLLNKVDEVIEIKNIKLFSNKTEFEVNGINIETKLLGEFNVYNTASAIALGLSQGIKIEKIKEALLNAKPAPGRMELVDAGQNFTVIVDYSYEPTSLENALKTVKVFNPNKIIVIIGSAGGGRDTWRRPVMGEVADKYSDIVIVTTDDPYDEDPTKIVEEVLAGVIKNKERILGENIFSIVDRGTAIEKAIDLAVEGDLILIAGKGGEVWMNVANGKKIPWDDRKIVKEILNKNIY